MDMSCWRGLAWIGTIGILTTTAHAAPAPAHTIEPVASARIEPLQPIAGLTRVRLDTDQLARQREQGSPFLIEGLDLPSRGPVTLQLEPYRVLAPDARIVVGTEQGDVPIEVDPAQYFFFRGHVVGEAGSHVSLAIGPRLSAGRIELGPGRPAYALGSILPQGERLDSNELAIFQTSGSAGHPIACETVGGSDLAPAGPPPMPGMRQGELAVDTDHELFVMFGSSEQDTIDYVIQLYAAISATTMRDVRVRLDIVFLRIWTTPNDPYGDFANFPQIPPEIEFDLAQLFSGVRVGSGAVGQLCNRSSYVAYALGFFTDTTTPNVNNQDIVICAHELGHCLGAVHTHSIGIDNCDNPQTPTRRGSFMGYCYYFSGGYANTDLRYRTESQARIRSCLNRQINLERFVFDCNQNGADDAEDIADGISNDDNANGIPDECEDCNANGTLDDEDIASGVSDDVNGNGVPDECEPDCNANGVPDELDIRSGFSEDLYANGVPDECEADCNANGVLDYHEIQLDMTLDIDRDAVLDACEDCDADGISDIDELDGANTLWAISAADGLIRQYHPVTGVLMRSGDGGLLSDPQDVLIAPDSRILVSDAGADDRVVEFDRHGGFVRVLVASGDAGLDDPGAMLLRDDGTLLIAGRASDNVLAFDIETGAFIREFVAAGDGGLLSPYGLTLAPNRNLLVGTGDDRVLEFDGSTGTFMRELVTPGDGGLLGARDLAVLDDGRLLVASEGRGAIFAYDSDTGNALGQFNYGSFENGLAGAWGLEIQNGVVYSSASLRQEFHLTDPRIMTFDPANGYSIRAFAQRPDSELRLPRGLDFMPDQRDCNRNLIPDTCDIADGRSTDDNDNGIPDECEDLCPADLDGDGDADADDFFMYLDLFAAGDDRADIDGDGDLDAKDFFAYLGLFTEPC